MPESTKTTVEEKKLAAAKVATETTKATSTKTEEKSGEPTFIPKVFQDVGKPEILKTEDIESLKEFPHQDRLKSAIENEEEVKLFKLTNPIAEGKNVEEQYTTQYDLNTYSKNGLRQRTYRLDKNKKLITPELP